MDERLLTASGAYGFWPANTEGDDIVVFDPASQGEGVRDRVELVRFNMLRQQERTNKSKPYRSLADFIAPVESGKTDYLGAFVVTTGTGADELVEKYESDHDDYHAIMVKALADRLVEAFAEYLHAQVRKDWGHADDEVVTNDDLLAERYRGIRPAFGYPACPDHSEKFKLFDLLEADQCGISLTESAAMMPAASVSGLYFAHPEATYFTVGRIGSDQVIDYAMRKGMSVDEVERWVSTSLGYEPKTNH